MGIIPSKSVQTWEDLFLTSEGVVRLTLYSIVFLLAYTFFGPAPISDRQIEFEREWAAQRRRGKHFQQQGPEHTGVPEPTGVAAPSAEAAAAKKDK